MHQIENIESKYIWKQFIDQGQFGVVYEAIRKDTQQPFAIKSVSKKKLKERLDDTLLKLIENEIWALTVLEHPNLVRVVDLCDDRKNYYIVQELMMFGTLTSMLEKIQKINKY